MHRILAVFILCLLAPWPGRTQSPGLPVTKYGRLLPGASLGERKMASAAWTEVRNAERYFVVVQVPRPPDNTEKERLAADGIVLSKKLTANSYLATISAKTSRDQWKRAGLTPFALSPSGKIDPRFDRLPGTGPDDVVAVSFYPGVDPALVRTDIVQAGGSLAATRIKPDHILFIKAGKETVRRLAALPYVISLSPLHLKDVPLNNNNRAEHGVDAVASVSGRNLAGRGVTIGIGDNADPSTHIDFAGKLIMRTDEPVDAHGTHTSGTLAGGGIINPLYQGMAPHARLVENDFSNILVNSPTYFGDFGMTISNNSYYNGSAGCPGEGDYNALSNFVDDQLIQNPKLMHVFAAGNDGNNTCSPYPASYATIKSGFQTGKNVITVGNINAYDNTPEYFSSRGPVDDGRIKPEVTAGGFYIFSTLPNNQYGPMNGTSMACPTVTGSVALLEERYRQLHGGSNPDGALVKALVCNNADDWGNAGPDFTYGFGLLNIRTAVEALEQNRFISGSVAQNEVQTLSIPGIPAGTQQVKIMLYWADPAAEPLAPVTLINDLDLTVADPGGVTHLPQVLDPSATASANIAAEGADHRNNIEQVVLQQPAGGTLTVKVKGTNLGQGPQAYYVTWEILAPAVNVEFPYGGETLVPGATEYIHWSAYGGEPNTFTAEYSTDGGASWTLIDGAVPAQTRALAWNIPVTVTRNALLRVTRNVSGYSGVSHAPFTIIGQPSLTVTKACPGYALLTWSPVPGADHYQVTQLTADSMRTIATVTDTFYVATPLNKDSTYWFSVLSVVGGSPGRRALAGSVLPNSGPCNLPALNNDIMTNPVTSPTSGRQYTSSQLGVTQIQLPVYNAGPVATPGPTTFSYQVNGGPVVTESMSGSLAANSGAIYQFSSANAYDFSAPGTYQIRAWVHNTADPIAGNDTSVVQISHLKNDPIVLGPSFTEGFESATVQTQTLSRLGLDSLDRADFGVSNARGRLSTFFNSGFARTGNRSITLDVSSQNYVAADSLITTYNLSAYGPADQIWLDVYFKKQSAQPAYSGNRIWIRGSDTNPWIVVKQLDDPDDPSGQYIHSNVDVSGVLAAASPAQTVSSSFQVRCGQQGNTPAASANPLANPGGGITFDDITLTRAASDVALLDLRQPSFDKICGLSAAETVSVLVRNYSSDTATGIPVTYAINNDTVTEYIARIDPRDSILYTFTQTADMSVYGQYHVRGWVAYPPDNYKNNDSLNEILVQTTPVIANFPYLEGFEQDNGYWYTNGQNDSWQWGVPQKTIIHKAANGSKAWVTNLTGNYADNQYSFLYSPCFDLSSLAKPVLSFSHIFNMEDDCDCDFHWVEYSLDDQTWLKLGQVDSGTRWYDNMTFDAWQLSAPRWHVSSYAVPVTAPKVRFRIVMYADPGTNYEGVGIDDIHVFDKAPVFTDSISLSLSQPVSGTGWVDFEKNGQRIASVNARGQDLGTVRIEQYIDSGAIRDTAGQYYGARNWVFTAGNAVSDSVDLRLYFTDSEAMRWDTATSCTTCLTPEDPYVSGITQFSRAKPQEDSELRNNLTGNYLLHSPQRKVHVIPYDNGYYASLTVKGFSEFWINGGGKNQDHPLAAWLESFGLVKMDTAARIAWTTWQEGTAGHFAVERSADSLHFSTLSAVPVSPHTDSIYSHVFTDARPLEGASYYRVRYISPATDTFYTPVLRLDFARDSVIIAGSMGIYPNPTTGTVHVITAAACYQLEVFDATGRLLIRRSTTGTTQTLSLTGLSRGVYVLKAWTLTGTKVARIQKR